MEDKSRPPSSGWRPSPWSRQDLCVHPAAVFLPLAILPVLALPFYLIAEPERPANAEALLLRPGKHPA